MLIRSQDKTELINMNNMDSISVVREEIVCCKGLTESTTIGKYYTEEAAIQVLDMIQKVYDENQRSIFSGCENASYKSCVFQMPEKDFR